MDSSATTHRYVHSGKIRPTLVAFMVALRTIEKAVRRLILAGPRRKRTITPHDPAVATLPERPRILLVRIDRIGDGIVSTPSVQSLRERFPEAVIDILLGEKNRMLGPLLPNVNHRFILEKQPWKVLQTMRTVRRNRYDIVINLHLNKSASATLASSLAKGRCTIEYGQDSPFSTATDGNHRREDLHVVALTSQLLAPLGIAPLKNSQAEEYPLTLALPRQARDNAQQVERRLFAEEGSQTRVFLNVSASHISRSWPPGCFAELAIGLRSNGYVPVLCGAPSDAETLERIALQTGGAALVLPTSQSYTGFAAELNLADIVVTPDTSTVHLAAALGKPTVAIYRLAITAALWGPWGVPFRVLSNADGVDTITSAEVLSATLELNLVRQELLSGNSDRSL